MPDLLKCLKHKNISAVEQRRENNKEIRKKFKKSGGFF